MIVVIALIVGAIGGESWRKGQWWAVTLGITLITLVINFLVELAYRRIDSRDSDNYSKFIENLLKFNKKSQKVNMRMLMNILLMISGIPSLVMNVG